MYVHEAKNQLQKYEQKENYQVDMDDITSQAITVKLANLSNL